MRDLLMVMFVDTDSDEEIKKLNEYFQFLSGKLAEKIIAAKMIDHTDASESPKPGELVH